MRRLMPVIGLELYALLLAAVQLHIGVRTDEAKYLLDIPYPHPPAARWLFSLLDGWEGQEILWRIVLATLLVQAVWLVAGIARDLSIGRQRAVMASWLFSAAVVLQAGTVMMAPLTALQGLVFVWLLLRERDNTAMAGVIGLLWFLSLFTAYQAVLFAPAVLAILLPLRCSWWRKGVIFLIPLALLALYTLINPLALASMVTHAGKDAAQVLPERLADTAWIWLLGGGGFLSIIGTIGLLLRPRWGLIGSLLLVTAYVFLSRYDYYAILFTPLFVAGLIALARSMPRVVSITGVAVPLGTTVFLWFYPLPQPSVAPRTIELIERHGGEGELLIAGSFGHEWQHASVWPVRRYREEFLPSARAVVCLASCDLDDRSGWMRADDAPVEIWLKELP